MKSEISLLNKTVFLKNITLFWPIWGGYLSFLLVTQPGVLFLRLLENISIQANAATNTVGYAAQDEEILSAQLGCMESVMNSGFLVVQTAVMAVFTGMALFHYLCVVKSTNMIHALPVTRGELYATNVISGLLFMVIPQIISFFFMMAVCLGNGISRVEYLGFFVLIEIGISVLWYSIVVFSAMLTGQMFAIPVFFVVINMLFVVLRNLMKIAIVFCAYGMQTTDAFFHCTKFDMLSPLFFLFERIGVSVVWENDEHAILEFTGRGYVAFYILAAALFFAAAYMLYRKRHLEHAGDLVSFSFAKPFFCWGVGFFSFYIMTMIGILLGNLIAYRIHIVPALVFGLFFSVLAFFISQMVLEKSFHVFRMKYIKECGGMILFVFCSLCILYGYAHKEQEFVPKEEQILDASIEFDYELEVSKQDYSKVCRLHKLLLDFGEKNYKWKNDNIWVDSPYAEVQGSVIVNYQLKNGKLISRIYAVPEEFEGQELISYFREQLADADNFLTCLMGEKYKEESPSKKWSYVTLYCDTQAEGLENIQTGESEYWLYDEVEEDSGEITTNTQVDEIYQALVADAKAGTLQKYNMYWEYEDEPCATLGMAWQDPLDENSSSMNIGDSDFWVSHDVMIYFGGDCRNIVKVLEKYMGGREDY